MIDKNKLVGGTLVALAVALASSAAFAERGDRMMGMGGMDGMGQGPMATFDFAAVDTDKDGKITQTELDAYRAAQAKALDTDGDGMMSEAELVAMDVKRATERASERAKAMIARLDADKDGKLSAVEMAVRPMPTEMLTRLDSDKDGALSEAELAAAKAQMDQRMGDRRADRGASGKRGSHHGWWQDQN